MYTTTAMSNQTDETKIDASVEDCKRLLVQAYSRYNDAVTSGAVSIASYWDGYIRGIQHVLEAQHE